MHTLTPNGLADEKMTGFVRTTPLTEEEPAQTDDEENTKFVLPLVSKPLLPSLKREIQRSPTVSIDDLSESNTSIST